MLKKNIKRILMLTILFTIIISFNLIGASAIDITLNGSMDATAVEAISNSIKLSEDTIVNIKLTDNATLAKSIDIKDKVKKITVTDDNNDYSLGGSKDLFNFLDENKKLAATSLVRIETYIGNNNKNVNYPSGFMVYNYNDGLAFLEKNQNAIYVEDSGRTLLDNNTAIINDAISKFQADYGTLHIVQSNKADADNKTVINLGEIGADKKSVIIDGRNPSSDNTKVYVKFTIATQSVADDNEKTVTLPENVFFAGSKGAYIKGNNDTKVYYPNVTKLIKDKGYSNTIYLDGTGHVLENANGSVTLYGNAGKNSSNNIDISFKNPDDYSSIKITLKGRATCSNQPYYKDNDNKIYHKPKSIGRLAPANERIYFDVTKTTDFGTIDRDLSIYDTSSSDDTVKFEMDSGKDIKVKAYNVKKGESGCYLDYPNKDKPTESFKKYYSKISSAKSTAIKDKKTLYFVSNTNVTYNLGDISGNLTVSGNGNVKIEYTSVNGTLKLKNGAQVVGGVYLRLNNEDVYYSNASSAIAKLKDSTPGKYSDDNILHINGSSSKVHKFGAITKNLSVKGHKVDDTNSKVKFEYDSLASDSFLELIGNDIESIGGSYLDSTNNGEDSKKYFGSLKAAYNYANDSDTPDGDKKRVKLDKSSDVYDLSSAATNWNGWRIIGESGVTVDLTGITFDTITLDGGVKSNYGFYTKSGDTRTYYSTFDKAAEQVEETPPTAATDWVYLDSSSKTYDLGIIDKNIKVAGSANVKYARILDFDSNNDGTRNETCTLKLHKNTLLAEGESSLYIEDSSENKIYYSSIEKTLDTYTDGSVLCAGSTINLGKIAKNYVVKGVGNSRVEIQYDSIAADNTLKLQGTADHFENTGGVFTVSSEDGTKTYYPDAKIAENKVTDGAILYFEKMSGASPYELGEVDHKITCRSDSGDVGVIKIRFYNASSGSVTILKKDSDELKYTSATSSSTKYLDTEARIYYSKSGSEKTTYYSTIEDAIKAYDSTTYETVQLTKNAQSDGTAVTTIGKAIVIKGISGDSDDELIPTVMPPLVINYSNVTLYNLKFNSANAGTSVKINKDKKNINIDECEFTSANIAIDATGAKESKITDCKFDNISEYEIKKDYDDDVDIIDNAESSSSQHISIQLNNTSANHSSLTTSQKAYVSLLSFANNEADIYIGTDKVNDDQLGNYFLKHLKVNNKNLYQYGVNEFYTIVDSKVSSVLIEAEVEEDSDAFFSNGSTKYSKTVALDIDKFNETKIKCSHGSASTYYTVSIYRKTQSDDSISRTVFNDNELKDVINLVAATGSNSNYSKGIIYEKSSNSEATVSVSYVEELKNKNIDLTVNLKNGFMTIDVSKLPEPNPGDTSYKFITSIPSGSVKNPNSNDIALKRVDFKVISLPSLREVEIDYNIITGINTDGIDFDKYDSSTVKVYYYNPSTSTYGKEITTSYYSAGDTTSFTAPHYSQYVLTAQEAPEGSNKVSLTATLIDTGDKPLSDYKIYIDKSARTTNSAGEVTFSSLDSSSGSLQILDDQNETVFTGTYRINQGSSNSWSASSDNLVITHTSDVTTLDVLFEYVSSTNINITDVDFYENPKTGFPFFTSTAGYITIGLILAAMVGLGFFVRKKFFLKQA